MPRNNNGTGSAAVAPHRPTTVSFEIKFSAAMVGIISPWEPDASLSTEDAPGRTSSAAT